LIPTSCVHLLYQRQPGISNIMPPKRALRPPPDTLLWAKVGPRADPSSWKRRRTEGEVLIETANDLPIAEFKERYIDPKWLSYSADVDASEAHDLDITLKSASELSKEELNACFNLIETTSKPDYEISTIGWHPSRKKREMKEDEMRYLLVRRRQKVPQECKYDEDQAEGEASEIEGFLSFMLTHDSSPAIPVLYIYEIHLAASLRGLGLGLHLMNAAEDVAKKVGVKMVMLTCFLSNVKAHGFYKKRGYVKDVMSPEDRKTRGRLVKVDHEVMSKKVD
jgi:N-alpha-acetyltransferase 40